MPTFPNRFRPVLLLSLTVIALGALLRGVLWWQFGRAAEISAMALPALLGAGALNDVVVSLYLFAPLSLYLLLMPDRWFRSAAGRLLLRAGMFLSVFGLIYLAVLEYYFFEEFNARLNLVAFDYLMYPHEVFVDIWESYPVVTVLLGSLLSSALVLLLMRRPLARTLATASALRQRSRYFAVHALLLVLAVVGFSTDSLARFSNRVGNEIASNGVSSFFRAARTSDIDYAAYYETGNTAANLRLLARDLGAAEGSSHASLRVDSTAASRPIRTVWASST
ncbi:MAG: hypothetical protein HC872_09750 [Gammaproteobacteria bacterium]|nr:hypothetical protein [Gammaproteobacteria bacterium]